MGFFDDDPFDNIIEEFFGRSRPRTRYKREQFIKGEDEERVIDFIETDEKVYLIFEIPGYIEKDVTVEINGKNIEITAQKKNLENVKDYLAQKLAYGMHYKRALPDYINTKKFTHTIKNGILEITFDKKK